MTAAHRTWLWRPTRQRRTFHPSEGADDVRRMLEYAGPKLAHVRVADCYNHRANIGNCYIISAPGVNVRIPQHFGTLRDIECDGIATVCVFGWEEKADDIHRRMLERVSRTSLLITRP